jgi:hypothetical protein
MTEETNEELIEEVEKPEVEGEDTPELQAEAQAEEDNAESAEEREAIRARRRQERHDKKEALRERDQSQKREIAARDHVITDLQSRLAAVEKRGQTTDVQEIDRAIKQSAEGYNYYKEQIALAAKAGDGVTLADATEKMIVSQRRYEDLMKVKNAAMQRSNQPAPFDPRVAQHAKAFVEKNKWYSPNSSDEDCVVLDDIDARMTKSGWNPTTPQYWQELETRAKKYLPHRFKTGTVSGQVRSPVAGSGRESAPSSSGGSSYKLSAERVQALKDSGKWENPETREKMIKYYKNYDKQQAAART